MRRYRLLPCTPLLLPAFQDIAARSLTCCNRHLSTLRLLFYTSQRDWQPGRGGYSLNRLYNEDCMEAMKLIPDNFFQLAITDPPYGIGIDRQKLNARFIVTTLVGLSNDVYASSQSDIVSPRCPLSQTIQPLFQGNGRRNGQGGRFD